MVGTAGQPGDVQRVVRGSAVSSSRLRQPLSALQQAAAAKQAQPAGRRCCNRAGGRGRSPMPATTPMGSAILVMPPASSFSTTPQVLVCLYLWKGKASGWAWVCICGDGDVQVWGVAGPA